MGNACGREARIQLKDVPDSMLNDDVRLSASYEPVSRRELRVASEKPAADWARAEWIRRKADGKKLVLKRVTKAALPTSKYYVFPCSADSVCDCQRCVARRAGRPVPNIPYRKENSMLWTIDPHRRGPPEVDTRVKPLELVLLQTNNDADRLPEFVECIETQDCYYYITKAHGIKKQKFSRLNTWFQPKYHPVNWAEYTRA